MPGRSAFHPDPADARLHRPAGRALENEFVRDHAEAPEAYPAVHHLTAPIRAAATAAGDAEHLNLWAGTGWQKAHAGPVAAVVHGLLAGR